MTLPISAIIDQLPDARDAALAAIAANTKLDDKAKERWVNATNKAYSWLVEQDQLDYDAETHELTIVSPDSGATYIANGICACTAFAQHQACWHRSASRLTRRALERQQTQQRQAVVDRLTERRKTYAEMEELFA